MGAGEPGEGQSPAPSQVTRQQGTEQGGSTYHLHGVGVAGTNLSQAGPLAVILEGAWEEPGGNLGGKPKLRSHSES